MNTTQNPYRGATITELSLRKWMIVKQQCAGVCRDGAQPAWGERPACIPTKLCLLVSHSGAARTPLATSAKKAFLTCRRRPERSPYTSHPPGDKVSIFPARVPIYSEVRLERFSFKKTDTPEGQRTCSVTWETHPANESTHLHLQVNPIGSVPFR